MKTQKTENIEREKIDSGRPQIQKDLMKGGNN
jgi:hypothetical protein